MNFIDRAIHAISPKWAFERATYRTALNSYNSGVPTRLSESWPMTSQQRYGTVLEQSQVLGARARAAHAFDNNPVARALVEIECDNVIGDGLNYQPTTDSEAWNREAQDKYYEWLEDCSVLGPDIETGFEVQRSIWEQSRVQGDVGWALVSRDTDERIDSRIQVVPAENIVTPDGAAGNPAIREGIRYDRFGRPLAFYVIGVDDRTGERGFTEIAGNDFVYFAHRTKRNQGRPPSCYITIFDLLSHLDRYVDGVSLAAWMATVFGLVIKKTSPNSELSLLGTATNSQGVQQKAVTYENGMVKYVGTDDEVVQVQASQPMQQTPEFIRTMFRMLGQPFKMPLEVLALDMSTANFASARIGLLPFYRQCRIKAARFGSRWSRTIRWWLSRERKRTRNDPKRWKSDWPELFWPHDLMCNEWDYTDPVSEAQADHLEMDMKTKSPQMVINQRGRYAPQIVKDWEEWNRLTKNLTQTHSSMSRDVVPPGTEPPSRFGAPPPDDDELEEVNNNGDERSDS